MLAALALHAALIGSAWLAPRPTLDGFWRPVTGLIDVDIESAPAAPSALSPAGAPGDARSAERAPAEAAPRAIAAVRARRALESVREPPAGVPAAAPAPRPEYDGPAPPVPVAGKAGSLLPGVVVSGVGSPGGSLEGVPAAPPAPTAAPKREIDRAVATGLLAESMRAPGEALGLTLPAAGNVASALASAARGAIGPVAGSATFLAILTPSGRVLGIAPVSWSGAPADAWAGAASTAAASLSGRTFSMVAPFTNGAVVWVSVTSTFVLPSGAESGIGPAEGGFRFDLADIGRRKQQVVRTSVRVAAVK